MIYSADESRPVLCYGQRLARLIASLILPDVFVLARKVLDRARELCYVSAGTDNSRQTRALSGQLNKFARAERGREGKRVDARCPREERERHNDASRVVCIAAVL